MVLPKENEQQPNCLIDGGYSVKELVLEMLQLVPRIWPGHRGGCVYVVRRQKTKPGK